MTDALNGWQPWRSSGDGIYRTRYKDGVWAEEEWVTAEHLEQLTACRRLLSETIEAPSPNTGPLWEVGWYAGSRHVQSMLRQILRRKDMPDV